MTIQRIPIPRSAASFTMRVMLERREYVLAMRWNARAGRWFMSIADSSGVLIATRPLTTNRPLLSGVVDARRPPGELVVLDTARLDTPIGLGELGTRAVLDYLEAADVAAMIAAGAG